jgi:pSer/pThr/pTyr-binding forkhead associated (FHA) protein
MIKLTLKTQGGEAEAKTYNYEFDQPVVTMGRLKENDIQLPHSTVSGFHAQILSEGENFYLVDRGSINGTFLNEQRLLAGEKKLLQDGDTIRVQTFELYFTSGIAAMPVDQGATIQVARQMVMELLGSWESQQEPRIIVMGGPNNGKQIELTEGKKIVIGRGKDCDIMIEHPTISRKHAEITYSWNGAFVKDLGSANGVYCNDVRIEDTHKLRDRDEVRLGQQNSNDAVRLVFSNPAEALLSKIEDAQITDSTPGAAQAVNVTGEKVEAPPAVPPPIPPTEPLEAEVMPPAPAEVLVAQGVATEPVREQVVTKAKKKGMSALAMGLLIGGALILLFTLVAGGLFFYTNEHTISEEKTTPEKGVSGEIVTISGNDLNGESVTSATVLDKDAVIVDKKTHEVQIRIPTFQNLPPGTRPADISLEGEKGTIAKATFKLITLPQIKSVNPETGRSGSIVNIETTGEAENLDVLFGDQKASVISQNQNNLQVRVPSNSETIPNNGLKVPITLSLEGSKSKETADFLLLPGLRIQSLVPSSGNLGSEVRIELEEIPKGVSVYFGNTEANIKALGDKEIIVTVPTIAENIPPAGLTVPVQLKVNNEPIGSKVDFIISPEKIETFQLSFSAQSYGNSLGFNEYSVASNIGPFLVVVAKDEYGSSKTRAEVIARNLNDKIPFFRQNLSAHISLQRVEGTYSIFADSDLLENRELLMHVYPDDALAYSKIVQRPVTVDALAEWWQMLIDSYFKVFVQIQSPASTGILGAGGTILQQVYNFYSLKTEQGTKYYKKDLLDTLPSDQKNRLVSLSLTPPKKIASVDGKWAGRMSNVLYSNISDQDLELILTMRQTQEGSVSGTADVNWKVGMGTNAGGFENVAYKKLGTYNITGAYQKSQSFPLEFSFVEKDGRRLQFVGKLEGEALIGSFAVSSSQAEGTWTVRLSN